jgi:glycosyltransferase involved in cell wall biosynthesis
VNELSQAESTAGAPRLIDVSIVVPIYNERENLEVLVRQINEAMSSWRGSYELIIVDDGSDDGSGQLLSSLATAQQSLHPIFLARRYGQSTAMQAGFDASRGQLIVSLDGDLQNDPADIPHLLEVVEARGADVVCGWRRDRQDPWLRRFLSSVANRIIGFFTAVKLHDYGCTLKVYRREFIERTRLYGEMHRFLPALLSEVGARTVEEAVNHRPRRFGTSKYGFSRTLRVTLDLILIIFLRKYLQRPLHVFGGTGVLFGICGFFILLYLSLEKIVWGQSIGDRPLLTLGVLLVVTGVMLLGLGLLGELIGRLVMESGNRRQYHLRTSAQLSSQDRDVQPKAQG